MTKPKPNDSFKYSRPDEIAECWDGISGRLCARLWSLMDKVPPIPNLEDSGPADHVGHGNLADLWDHLTDDEAITLNELAEKLAEEQYDDQQHG